MLIHLAKLQWHNKITKPRNPKKQHPHNNKKKSVQNPLIDLIIEPTLRCNFKSSKEICPILGGEVDPVGLLGHSTYQYKQGRNLPLLDTLRTQASCLRERSNSPYGREEAIKSYYWCLTSLIICALHYTCLNSISRIFCWVFSPMRVSHDKYMCYFMWLCLSFFQ